MFADKAKVYPLQGICHPAKRGPRGAGPRNTFLGYTSHAMSNRCHVHRLGLMDYQQAWQLQDSLVAEIAEESRPDSLLLLEHPHTYTFGRRGNAENLLWDEIELARRGVSIHWVDRGGDVTYHGPGQLVGYPLLKLGSTKLRVDASNNSAHLPQADYVGYVRRLEQVIILTLARLGISARQVEGLTGVWVDTQDSPAKIAAIGVKVDARGVTRHGFALNVDPDMSYWEGIIGCGLVGYPVTCMANLLAEHPPMAQVIDETILAFAQVFGYEMIEV